MIEKIREVYQKINEEFLMNPFGHTNDKIFRKEFKKRLEHEFIDSVIKCDEENNLPYIIVSCCLVARVSWKENHQDKYCDLVFGQPTQVINISQRLLDHYLGSMF